MFTIFIIRLTLICSFLGSLVLAVPPELYTSHSLSTLLSHNGIDFWETYQEAKRSASGLGRGETVIYTIDTGGIEGMFSKRPQDARGEWEVKSNIPRSNIKRLEVFKADRSSTVYTFKRPRVAGKVHTP